MSEMSTWRVYVFEKGDVDKLCTYLIRARTRNDALAVAKGNAVEEFGAADYEAVAVAVR